MSNDLPSPLVPADCDLRDFQFMPLDVDRLRDSDLAALESPEACWAAVLLWCASWHQMPAASLPDDDRVLSKLAGYGRVIHEWERVKPGALRSWIKCSDGRLYHPVVAEKAVEAWQRRRTASDKGKAGASKRWGTGNSTANGTDAPAIEKSGSAIHVNGSGIGQPMPGDSNRQGQGQGQVRPSQPSTADAVEGAGSESHGRRENGTNPRALGTNPRALGTNPRAQRNRSLAAWRAATAAIDQVKGTDRTWADVKQILSDPIADRAIEAAGGHRIIADRDRFTQGSLEERFRKAYEREAKGA